MRAETDIQTTISRVQETLDALFCERLIPFRLIAHKVNSDGPEDYILPFYNSRIDSVSFSWKNGESFKEALRAAIVDGLERMRGTSERLIATSHVRRALVLSVLVGGVALMFPRNLLARFPRLSSLATSKGSKNKERSLNHAKQQLAFFVKFGAA